VFLKYLDFVFAPFRAINNKIVGAKSVKGSIQGDIGRSKALANRGKDFAARAGQVAHMSPGAPPGTPSAPPPAKDANPPVRTSGWLFKKKFCTQCNQQLDNSWDSCPYCAQAAQLAASAPKAAMKTQAFAIDAAGGAGGMQLLGWIVALQGPQKGELFTLSPVTTIGTDPTCTVVLQDKFMSAKHAEIKAEGGMWILKDTGSTNGTWVNNKRIDRHELVDNDFVKFGGALVKFKSL
jgi:hypothetical protein